jgi:hypothetical protein
MKYPHLPHALHRLLEAGPWEGTAAELYEALEGRQEPWPPNPVALALWLKHHGLGWITRETFPLIALKGNFDAPPETPRARIRP